MKKKLPELKNCTGCMACVYACPSGAITIVDTIPKIDEQKCFGCWHCVEVCEAREEEKTSIEAILKYMPSNCRECGFSCAEIIMLKKLDLCKKLGYKMKKAVELIINSKNILHIPVTDATIPVETGLIESGNPRKDSPVIATSNYLHTISNLTLVLERCGLDAYVVAVDTDGYCMSLALTLGYFTPVKLREAIKKAKLEKRVFHRIIILPQQARIYDFSDIGWEIVFAPNKMEELPAFLIRRWKNIIEDYIMESII